MSKIVGKEEFLNTEEAAKEFGVSKQTFYANSKRYLRVHRFDGKRSPWYSKSEVQALASGKPIRKASIAITGMFSDWTEHARSLGFNIRSEDRETKIETLPTDLKEAFSVSTDEKFVRRTQMSFVDATPICAWSTWYPVSLIGDILPEMLSGSFHDVVGHLAKQGRPVSDVSDVYSSRITTFDEQNLFEIANDEPIIILQRMAQTEDKTVTLLFQDMQLLSSWFVIKRTEKINYWNK